MNDEEMETRSTNFVARVHAHQAKIDRGEVDALDGKILNPHEYLVVSANNSFMGSRTNEPPAPPPVATPYTVPSEDGKTVKFFINRSGNSLLTHEDIDVAFPPSFINIKED